MIAPVLTHGPVRLLPFARRHLSERYVGWLNSAQLMRFSEQRHRRHDIASCRAYVAGFTNSPNLLWAVEDFSSEAHVGNVAATIDPANGLADIGILIGGGGRRGYGSAAWRAVLGYLAGRGDIRKITGGCVAGNSAMIAIMEGAGMIPDGRRKAHFLVGGEPMDVVHYAHPC
ncbi:GNAT family N-acetyltransferase [Gymnodinialimonas ceratoperidinii]|uniref:GNAT family N-acetyltransferase n=1 Tax=Gymnodinialimonas ceratoperidinii TaxID=2856823 RepID=A0A8F6TUU8_9RHOB|nr:GNAT family protein [Gymnodinialimonas ceratoperidinii]QXT39387.1 GNAT family N-acetyltransferase [Gymnodinialimonas ceratoperidinii]